MTLNYRLCGPRAKRGEKIDPEAERFGKCTVCKKRIVDRKHVKPDEPPPICDSCYSQQVMF